MKKTAKIVCVVAVTAIWVHVLLLTAASESMAFRCGRELISIGESSATLLARCGEPDWTKKSNYRDDRGIYHIAEKWYYNCGEGDFIYVLTLENDLIIKEETSGRGTGPPIF